MEVLGVSIATNGRNMPLLGYLITRWLQQGASAVCVTSTTEVCGDVFGHLSAFDPAASKLITRSVGSTAPEHLGRMRQLGAMALCEAGMTAILHSDDDVLPLSRLDSLVVPSMSLRAVALIGVTGERWFDWATHVAGQSRNQDYDQHGHGTYVTLASQCVSADLARAVDYEQMGGFRRKQDVKYCRAAVAAGGELLPPAADGPLLCHLDR